MKKINLVLVMLLISFTVSKSQVVTGNLYSRNTIKIDNDKLIVCGYIMNGSQITFTATLFDKKMNVLKKYEKDIPIDKFTGMRYEMLFGEVLLVVIGGKPNTYHLQLSKDLKEIYFCEKTQDPAVKNPDNGYVYMSNFQFELEGDPYGLGYAGGLRRSNEIKNHRFLKNDILDFDIKTGLITRYEFNENGKLLYPSYKPLWSSQIANGQNLKLTGFEYVDEEDILGSFIVKVEGEWKDYVCKLESKTGNIIFFKEVKYPDETEVFSISNAFYDKRTKNFIVVGQLLLKKSGKDRKHALGILVYDSKGDLINTKKIDFPEINLKEPKGFDFKDKEVCAKDIGVLQNGNYFIVCENLVTGPASFYGNYLAMNPNAPSMVTGNGVIYQAVAGFSYYELNSKFDLVLDNFKLVEDFSKKYISYAGFYSEKKKVVYSTIDGLNVNCSAMDIGSKDESAIALLNVLSYDFKTLKNTEVKKRDVFSSYVLDDHVIIFQKKGNTDEYTFKSVGIK